MGALAVNSRPPNVSDGQARDQLEKRGAKDRGVRDWIRVRAKWIKRDWRLYALLSLPMLFLIVFNYIPLVGRDYAFRNF